MKYCVECAAELNDSAQFCNKCGANQIKVEQSIAEVEYFEHLAVPELHRDEWDTIQQFVWKFIEFSVYISQLNLKSIDYNAIVMSNLEDDMANLQNALSGGDFDDEFNAEYNFNGSEFTGGNPKKRTQLNQQYGFITNLISEIKTCISENKILFLQAKSLIKNKLNKNVHLDALDFPIPPFALPNGAVNSYDVNNELSDYLETLQELFNSISELTENVGDDLDLIMESKPA